MEALSSLACARQMEAGSDRLLKFASVSSVSSGHSSAKRPLGTLAVYSLSAP